MILNTRAKIVNILLSILVTALVLAPILANAQYVPPASQEDIEYKVEVSSYTAQATTSMTVNVSNVPSGFLIQSVSLFFSAPVNKTTLEIYQIRGNATSMSVEPPKADVLKYFAVNMFEARSKVKYMIITFSVSTSYLEEIGATPEDLLVAVYIEETGTWAYYSVNVTQVLADRIYLEALVPPSTIYALVKKRVSEITYTVVQKYTNTYSVTSTSTLTKTVEKTVATTVTSSRVATVTKTSTYTLIETRTVTKSNTRTIVGAAVIVFAVIILAAYLYSPRK